MHRLLLPIKQIAGGLNAGTGERLWLCNIVCETSKKLIANYTKGDAKTDQVFLLPMALDTGCPMGLFVGHLAISFL